LFLRTDVNLENQIRAFWHLEEVNQLVHSPQERECELHFKDHTTRLDSGRYVVELPMSKEHKPLGKSKHKAIHRLHLLERRLERNESLRLDYIRFMREYETLGHMERIESSNTQDNDQNYYMPHHPVFKQTSSTTKTRVVFDASAKTDNGSSLNDILLVGPVVQDDLCSIIIRFLIHQIAFTSDIEKTYRQVKIHSKDHHLQCILWRERPQDQLTTYELTTVTYGSSAAPILAARCLKQLAHDEAENFSKAAPILLRDFYVDDCISGAETLEEALKIQSQLQDLNSGGFTLRKWCSNSTELLATIPPELQ
jgi:hypothetical protein